MIISGAVMAIIGGIDINGCNHAVDGVVSSAGQTSVYGVCSLRVAYVDDAGVAHVAVIERGCNGDVGSIVRGCYNQKTRDDFIVDEGKMADLHGYGSAMALVIAGSVLAASGLVGVPLSMVLAMRFLKVRGCPLEREVSTIRIDKAYGAVPLVARRQDSATELTVV